MTDHPELDTDVPHSARVWNHWLGGKDNYPVDRATGDRVAQHYPDIVAIARAARGFLRRSVSHLAGECGIDQFLDIGTGLPTADNTHQIAQQINPAARIVYVDNDPLVLTHARALLTSSPEGETAYIDADIRDPGAILDSAAQTLDLGRPVAVTLIAILHHIDDYDEARRIVHMLMEPLPSGSYIALSHSTNAIGGRASDEAVAQYNKFGRPPVRLRGIDEITGFFDGLELLPPGVVSTPRWRPPVSDPDTEPAEIDQFCGVARKS